MTVSPPAARSGPRWFIRALVFLLLFVFMAGAAHAAQVTGVRPVRTNGSAWFRSAVAFLVAALGAGYIGYFWFFPRLLRRKNPAWPLDAWRQTSYYVWAAICIATLFFKGPLMAWLKPYLDGIFKNLNETVKNSLSPHFMEWVLIPLVLLIGPL